MRGLLTAPQTLRCSGNRVPLPFPEQLLERDLSSSPTDEDTEAQRGSVTSVRSHSLTAERPADLRSLLSYSGSRPFSLENHTPWPILRGLGRPGAWPAGQWASGLSVLFWVTVGSEGFPGPCPRA